MLCFLKPLNERTKDFSGLLCETTFNSIIPAYAAEKQISSQENDTDIDKTQNN